jgi:hypothetical protein
MSGTTAAQDNYLLVEMPTPGEFCAAAGSVIQAVTAGSRAFQVCTRTSETRYSPTTAWSMTFCSMSTSLRAVLCIEWMSTRSSRCSNAFSSWKRFSGNGPLRPFGPAISRTEKAVLTTESATLLQTQYLAAGDPDRKGTNPYELTAAAHAGCFSTTLVNDNNNSPKSLQG